MHVILIKKHCKFVHSELSAILNYLIVTSDSLVWQYFGNNVDQVLTVLVFSETKQPALTSNFRTFHVLHYENLKL